MGIARKELEEVLHVLVYQAVVADLVLEVVQLLGIGQFTIEQQVGDLQEGGLLGQLVDGITAVVQDTLFAIEEGDGAGGGARVLVPVVQRDVAAHIAQLADVDGLLAFATDIDREFVRLAIQNDLRLLAHRFLRVLRVFIQWPLR